MPLFYYQIRCVQGDAEMHLHLLLKYYGFYHFPQLIGLYSFVTHMRDQNLLHLKYLT